MYTVWLYMHLYLYDKWYKACLFISYQMILDDVLLWYLMFPSIISTACVMFYCVFVYIDSGCCCVDFHLQLQLEVVWRQVEDPSNPGHFYYYNQAWRPKKIVEEFDDSQQITFEATGETTWEVPAEFAEVRHWVVMVSLMLCVFLVRQEDFGISGNYQDMFLQKKNLYFVLFHNLD